MMTPFYVLTTVFSYLVANASVALQLVGSWFTFKKMGLPGWKGLIPYYSMYVLFEKLWDKKQFWRTIVYLIIYTCTLSFGYILLTIAIVMLASGSSQAPGIIFLILGVLFLIAFIVFLILTFVIEFKLYKKLAHAFGLKDAWAWGLLFIPCVMLPIIGFHKNITYYGPINQV